MVSKIVCLSLMVTLAVANAAKLSSSENKDLVSLAKESRLILEVPILGAVILKALKVIWFVISTGCSIIGFKFTALALAASTAVWIFENSSTFFLGASLAYLFCKLTGKCSWYAKELIGLPEELVYAAKNLDDGLTKYGSSFDQ